MEQTEVVSINNILKNSENPFKIKNDYDEPGIYFAFGNICFATGTFLLGLINFYNYNPIMLTIYGLFFPGVGQIITARYAYKVKLYMDGNIYFFFAINWFITGSYDLFPIWGWMNPLTHTEYGVHNLMCTFFVIVFFTQNIFGKSYLLKVMFSFIICAFILSTIGNFADSKGVKKAAGIFNFIIAIMAYYDGFAMIINQKRNIITMPLFDGKTIGQKLE